MTAGKGIKAGKAFVELFADNTKLIRALRVSEKKLKEFGSRVHELGKKLTRFATIIALPMAGAAKVFADFEQQMANVSTMLDNPE